MNPFIKNRQSSQSVLGLFREAGTTEKEGGSKKRGVSEKGGKSKKEGGSEKGSAFSREIGSDDCGSWGIPKSEGLSSTCQSSRKADGRTENKSGDQRTRNRNFGMKCFSSVMHKIGNKCFLIPPSNPAYHHWLYSGHQWIKGCLPSLVRTISWVHHLESSPLLEMLSQVCQEA